MPREQKGIGRQGKKHKRKAEFDIHRRLKVPVNSEASPATAKPVQESTTIEQEADPAEASRDAPVPEASLEVVDDDNDDLHPRYRDGKPLLPGCRPAIAYGEEKCKWDPDQPPMIPSDERPDKVFGSVVAAEAIAAANLLERAFPRQNPEDSDYEEDYYDDEDSRLEGLDSARIKYKHALRRLAAEFPELMIPPGLHAGLDASKQETRPCPCGVGRLPRWPWALQTVCLGFCPSSNIYVDWSKLGSYWDMERGDPASKHSLEMINWREEWMLAAPGGERINDNSF